jgi:hypothetical protein
MTPLARHRAIPGGAWHLRHAARSRRQLAARRQLGAALAIVATIAPLVVYQLQLQLQPHLALVHLAIDTAPHAMGVIRVRKLQAGSRTERRSPSPEDLA